MAVVFSHVSIVKRRLTEFNIDFLYSAKNLYKLNSVKRRLKVDTLFNLYRFFALYIVGFIVVSVLLWPPYVIGRPLYFCPVVSIYGHPM